MTYTKMSHGFFSDNVLNIAHRGASYDAPENTMPAFHLAANMGAYGIECDAQLTKDGEVVIFHDVYLNRTSTGTGKIADNTLAELRKLDAGSWKDSRFSHTSIPTLDEVFDEMPTHFLFNIELKSFAIFNQKLEAAVARLIDHHRIQDRVIVSSFNLLSLLKMRRIDPSIKLGLLWSPYVPLFLYDYLIRYVISHEGFHPHWKSVTVEMVKQARRHGRYINVWTCDDSLAMQRLIKMGVASIITNRPNLLREVLYSETK